MPISLLDSCIGAIRKMYMEYSVIFPNVIVLFMVILREHLHVPLERSNLFRFCIRYRGVVVGNAILKSKINPYITEFVFAKALKACMLGGNYTL